MTNDDSLNENVTGEGEKFLRSLSPEDRIKVSKFQNVGEFLEFVKNRADVLKPYSLWQEITELNTPQGLPSDSSEPQEDQAKQPERRSSHRRTEHYHLPDYDEFKKQSAKEAQKAADKWSKKPDFTKARTRQEVYDLARRQAHDRFAKQNPKLAKEWAQKYKDKDLTSAAGLTQPAKPIRIARAPAAAPAPKPLLPTYEEFKKQSAKKAQDVADEWSNNQDFTKTGTRQIIYSTAREQAHDNFAKQYPKLAKEWAEEYRDKDLVSAIQRAEPVKTTRIIPVVKPSPITPTAETIPKPTGSTTDRPSLEIPGPVEQTIAVEQPEKPIQTEEIFIPVDQPMQTTVTTEQRTSPAVVTQARRTGGYPNRRRGGFINRTNRLAARAKRPSLSKKIKRSAEKKVLMSVIAGIGGLPLLAVLVPLFIGIFIFISIIGSLCTIPGLNFIASALSMPCSQSSGPPPTSQVCEGVPPQGNGGRCTTTAQPSCDPATETQASFSCTTGICCIPQAPPGGGGNKEIISWAKTITSNLERKDYSKKSDGTYNCTWDVQKSESICSNRYCAKVFEGRHADCNGGFGYLCTQLVIDSYKLAGNQNSFSTYVPNMMPQWARTPGYQLLDSTGKDSISQLLQGDVIFMETHDKADHHVVVVQDTNIDSNGSGTIDILQANSRVSGKSDNITVWRWFITSQYNLDPNTLFWYGLGPR